MPRPQPLAFLSDHNVPVSVGQILSNRGHDVARVADLMPVNSPDPVVATAAIEGGLILLSWDRDFNHQRFMKPRFAPLCRIDFALPEPEGAARLEAVLDLVEFAFARANGRPVRIRIAADKFLIHG